MPIVHNFEKHKYLPQQRLHHGGNLSPSRTSRQVYLAEGEGIVDTISTGVKGVVDFVKNNPELVKEGAKAVTATKSAISDISKAVESSNRLKELQAIKEIQKKNAKVKKPLSDEMKNEIKSVALKTKEGNGFAKF